MIRAALAGLALLAPLAATASGCSVKARRSVPIEMAGGLMVVSVTVNGTDLPFLLDTGAERSVIGSAAAAALHLARDEWVSTDILGLGGRERQRLGRPQSMALDGLKLRRSTVVGDNTVVVGTIPTEVGGHPVAGLLGQDFLSPFDLDLDPARGRLTLYDVSMCAGNFLPWQEPYTAVPASRLVRNVLAVPVAVNGLAMQAAIDTGSQRSVLTAPGARRLGLLPGGSVAVTGFGRGSKVGQLGRYTVQVGSLTATGMPLLATEVHLLRSIDMLLGADWLGSRHVWVSWASNQILVATQAP